jgi:hypothetical protein
VSDLPQWKTNFNFVIGVLLKYIYDGPKSTLGIRITVRLDLDRFGQNRILDKNYDSSQTIGLRVVAKYAGSEKPVFSLLIIS